MAKVVNTRCEGFRETVDGAIDGGEGASSVMRLILTEIPRSRMKHAMDPK